MNDKIVSVIIRAGAVVITTLLSFAVYPPVITPGGPVQMKSVYTFFAGIISIVLFDQFKKVQKVRQLALGLLGLLIVLLSIYAVAYNQYSVTCTFRDGDGPRIIAPHAVAKSDKIARRIADWAKEQPTVDARVNILIDYRCSATEIWNMQDLAAPYFGLQALYFAMVATLTVLLIIMSDIIRHNPKSTK